MGVASSLVWRALTSDPAAAESISKTFSSLGRLRRCRKRRNAAKSRIRTKIAAPTAIPAIAPVLSPECFGWGGRCFGEYMAMLCGLGRGSEKLAGATVKLLRS